MGIFGVVGVWKRWQVLMGSAHGNTLEVAGWISLNSLYMMWGMVLEWNFGSMCGVGIVLSKRPFWSFRACLVTIFVFLFSREKEKNKFFLFSKWKTRLVSCFEKHIFQKQNSGNLFGSCFWKSWILFSLVNFFFF